MINKADIVQDLIVWLSEPQTWVMAVRAANILNMAGQGGGKSAVIGYSSGMFVQEFPRLRGFIGANTENQLSQSTLAAVFKIWEITYGLAQYDKYENPTGAFVVDRRPPIHFTKFHRLRNYRNTISFWNGALIYIGSLENYTAHDGKEFGWAHLDETKDTRKEAVQDVIQGRLRQVGLWYDQNGDLWFDDSPGAVATADQRGWTAWNPLYIHTSPAQGGVEWLNEMFSLQKFSKEIKDKVMQKDRAFFVKEFSNKAVCIYSAHHNQPNQPPNYISNQEENAEDEDALLRKVYGYPFGKTGGEWLHSFRRDKHARPWKFKPGLSVHQTWDFNATPYVTQINAQIDIVTRYWDDVLKVKHEAPAPGLKAMDVMVIHFYKEYCLDPPQDTTEASAEAFAADHDPTVTELFYYGDANGLTRIEGLGSQTNYKYIEDVLFAFMHNDSKKVKMPNVGVFARRDLLNKILAGKIPSVEIYFDPEGCPLTILDCELVKKGPKGKVKEEETDPITKKKFQKRGHQTDAVEYLVSEVCKHYLKTD